MSDFSIGCTRFLFWINLDRIFHPVLLELILPLFYDPFCGCFARDHARSWCVLRAPTLPLEQDQARARQTRRRGLGKCLVPEKSPLPYKKVTRPNQAGHFLLITELHALTNNTSFSAGEWLGQCIAP
jgi:hypothetical protein